MSELDPPSAPWWFDLSQLARERAGREGPALSNQLLAEEAVHGATHAVAWAYADAVPALLGGAPSDDTVPLACWRGAVRAAAMQTPRALEGLWHVQTSSPEVCRALGPRVPSFHVRGRECVEALVREGSGVREVVAVGCAPFDAKAPFRVRFASDAGRKALPWFVSPVAEQFLPILRLDLDVWLCWDRDLCVACVVRGRNSVVPGRWGPRDVSPERAPAPWAEREAFVLDGAGWAATMLDDQRRAPATVDAAPSLGWWLLSSQTDGYSAALRSAWRANKPLQVVESHLHATAAGLRFEGKHARYSWLGLQRVLRLRGGALEQLTADHDLRRDPDAFGFALTPEMQQQLEGVTVTTRGLPTHAPEQGSCRIEPGDRFVLLGRSAHERLEAAAGGPEALARTLGEGSVREVARWARRALSAGEHEQPVVLVDAGAVVHERDPQPVPAAHIEPTVRDLIERPAEFEGRRVRLRGIFRSGVERQVFADAWFETRAHFPYGAWLVEAEGLWRHDGSPQGHMDFYKSALLGDARKVHLAGYRPVAPERIRFERSYVPLSSEIELERRLGGWTFAGRWLSRLGSDARLPEPAVPERRRARVRFMVDAFGMVGLFSWELLGEGTALSPERVSAAEPGARGRYVEVEGRLDLTGRFPRIDDALEFTPPSMTRSSDRHVIPSPELMERTRALLGEGRRVVVRGELKSPRSMYALSIEDESGPLEF